MTLGYAFLAGFLAGSAFVVVWWSRWLVSRVFRSASAFVDRFLRRRPKIDWSNPDYAPPAFEGTLPHGFEGTERVLPATYAYRVGSREEKIYHGGVAPVCVHCGGGRLNPIHRR